MEGFKAGDVVQMKSGGPTMTIWCIVEGTATCQWFVDQKLEQGSIGVASLVAVELDASD